MSNRMEIVSETLAALGVKALRPLRWMVAVRTEPRPVKTAGGLWLPPSVTSLYSGLPHQCILTAVVLAAGPKAHVNVGDRVVFQRLHFQRLEKMPDDTYVGFVDYNQLAGFSDDDEKRVDDHERAVAQPPDVCASAVSG